MGSTRMFRNRAVSLEQTQEYGEKHLELIKGLLLEAYPSLDFLEHGLEPESDLFLVTLIEPPTGRKTIVSFNRMVLAEPAGVASIAADRESPTRHRLLELLQRHRGRPRVAVTYTEIQSPEERREAEALDAEWRRQRDQQRDQRKAEERRRADDKRRTRQKAEEARRRQVPKEQRPRPPQPQARRRPPASQATPASQAMPASQATPPQPSGGPPGQQAGGGRKRRRRNRRGRGPSGPGGPSGGAPPASGA